MPLYQVRYYGRKVFQTDDVQAVIDYLGSRNPALYEVWGLAAITLSVRWIQSGDTFLKAARAKGGT